LRGLIWGEDFNGLLAGVSSEVGPSK